MTQQYLQLPPIPGGQYSLSQYSYRFFFVVPEERTNLLRNPSVENFDVVGVAGIFGWDDDTLSFTQDPASTFRGTVGILVGSNSQALNTIGYWYYGDQTGYTVTLTSGGFYIFSAWVNAPLGQTFRLGFHSTGTALGQGWLSYRDFKGTGYWNRYHVLHRSTSTTTYRVVLSATVMRNQSGNYSMMQADCFQLERALNSGPAGSVEINRVPTTYIDGDLQGLVPNQYPKAYQWTGRAHDSTSIRSAQTRAGGYLVAMEDYGMSLATLVGLGLAQIEVISHPFSSLDGADFQDIVHLEREFSLAYFNQRGTSIGSRAARKVLHDILSRDNVGLRQPMKIMCYPVDDRGNQAGDWGSIVCTYTGGMEGNYATPYGTIETVSFIQQQPHIRTRDVGDNQFAGDYTSVDRGMYRDLTGAWNALTANGSILTILQGDDGYTYFGGEFTNFGGVTGADYFARFDPITNTFALAGSASAFVTASVKALEKDTQGRIYVGGNFTNVGDANGDRIVRYNPSSNTFTSLSTGINGGIVYDLTFSPSDNAIYIVGSFAAATAFGVGSINRAVRWNISSSTGSALGTGLVASNQVNTCEHVDGRIYVGGDITSLGGVSGVFGYWDVAGAAWVVVATSISASAFIFDTAAGNDGALYLVGDFTTIAGVSCNRAAKYDGANFTPLGDGLDQGAIGCFFDGSGVLWVFGSPTTAGGYPISSNVARWLGTEWASTDLVVPHGTGAVGAVHLHPQGYVFVGAQVAYTLLDTTPFQLKNTGTLETYPRFRVHNFSTTDTHTIYSFNNITSGKSVFVQYDLQPGEEVILNADPLNLYFTSSSGRDLLSELLPGSDMVGMAVQMGWSYLTVVAEGDTDVTVSVDFPLRYQGIDDLVWGA